MLGWLQGLMRAQPLLVFSLVVAIGYLIGKFRIKGFELGGVTGVLFTALVFGHFGYEGSPILQTLGFMLFMYLVGYDAGPQFFSVVVRDGLKYLLLALGVALAGFVVTMLLGHFVELPPGAIAGVLAGGMTTTPTLAAAQDAVTSGQVILPEGITTETVVGNIGAAYAITYLFGLMGMIAIIKAMPKLMNVDLAADAAKIESMSGGDVQPSTDAVQTRAYRILAGNRVIGETRRLFEQRFDRQVLIEKLRRQGEFIDLTDDMVLQGGDEVTVVGLLSKLRLASGLGAEELSDPAVLDLDTESAQIVVTKPHVVGVTLAELDAKQRFAVLLQRITRAGVKLEPSPALCLQRGDVLQVTAPRANLEVMGQYLGHLERSVDQTDLVTYMSGTALGLILGSITILVKGIPVGLGMAGGLLLVGILVGFLRSIYPTFGRVPAATLWTTKELGLLFFMAGVGLQAGHGIVETLRMAGFSLFLCGMVVTTVPIIAGWVLGRHLLGMGPSTLMGAITGAMTNTACLKLVCDEAKSSVPALGYAGAYVFANVILTVAGSLIVRFTL
jgi:putative transport protein